MFEKEFESAIKKWEYLSSGKADHVPDCAFCDLFGDDCDDPELGYCILFKDGWCCGGLYHDWSNIALWSSLSWDSHYNTSEAIEAAKKVLQFIKDKRKKKPARVRFPAKLKEAWRVISNILIPYNGDISK